MPAWKSTPSEQHTINAGGGDLLQLVGQSTSIASEQSPGSRRGVFPLQSLCRLGIHVKAFILQSAIDVGFIYVRGVTVGEGECIAPGIAVHQTAIDPDLNVPDHKSHGLRHGRLPPLVAWSSTFSARNECDIAMLRHEILAGAGSACVHEEWIAVSGSASAETSRP